MGLLSGKWHSQLGLQMRTLARAASALKALGRGALGALSAPASRRWREHGRERERERGPRPWCPPRDFVVF